MDLGVGMFIFTSGLTSKRSRRQGMTSTSSSSSSPSPSSYLLSKLSNHYSGISCVVLGVVRLVVLKALNYQEHSSEYGTHWNFFLSMTCIWIVTEGIYLFLVNAIRSFGLLMMNFNTQQQRQQTRLRCQDINDKNKSSTTLSSIMLVASFFIIVCYQFMLARDRYQLSDWIFNAPREVVDEDQDEGSGSSGGGGGGGVRRRSIPSMFVSFFISNREGILGILPFSVIYMVAQCVSHLLIFSPQTQKRKHVLAEWFYRLLLLLTVSTCWWILFALFHLKVQPTSRRLANGAYVCFVLAVGFSLLSLSLLLDLAIIGGAPNRFLSKLSDHQLFAFVIANLMTGLVNLGFPLVIKQPTMKCGDWMARLVLVIYCFTLSQILDKVNVSKIFANHHKLEAKKRM
jgi:hypothetical protein